MVRGQPASPDAQLWEAARSRVEVRRSMRLVALTRGRSATKGNFLSVFTRRLYTVLLCVSFVQIQRDVLQRRDGFASSRAWQHDVRIAVDLLPHFDDSATGSIDDNSWQGQDCGVCGRAGHPAACTVQLSGPLCNTEGIMVASQSVQWWTKSLPCGDLRIYTASYPSGRFWCVAGISCITCRLVLRPLLFHFSRQRLECYSALQHFKLRLLADLSSWLRRRLWGHVRSPGPSQSQSLASLHADDEHDRVIGSPSTKSKVQTYGTDLLKALTAYTRSQQASGMSRNEALQLFAVAPQRRTFLLKRRVDIKVSDFHVCVECTHSLRFQDIIITSNTLMYAVSRWE